MSIRMTADIEDVHAVVAATAALFETFAETTLDPKPTYIHKALDWRNPPEGTQLDSTEISFISFYMIDCHTAEGYKTFTEALEKKFIEYKADEVTEIDELGYEFVDARYHAGLSTHDESSSKYAFELYVFIPN
jgi:hypothetical protein